MLLYRIEKRRAAHARADLITDIAVAYGGCQSDKGAAAMTWLVELLRGA